MLLGSGRRSGSVPCGAWREPQNKRKKRAASRFCALEARVDTESSRFYLFTTRQINTCPHPASHGPQKPLVTALDQAGNMLVLKTDLFPALWLAEAARRREFRDPGLGGKNSLG